MKKKLKKLKFIFPVVIILVILALFLTPKLLDSLPMNFSISSDANFYIDGYHNIEGYQLNDSEFKKVSDEKIDIVKWDEDPAIYIANSLSPAKVVSVDVSEEEKSSYVVVPDYQLSLAIGKAGQNARLAAKLTNWKIDIKSETQAAEEPFAGFGNAEDGE